MVTENMEKWNSQIETFTKVFFNLKNAALATNLCLLQSLIV
jgi:hypothetical protein